MPALPQNVEPSAFKQGEYRIYDGMGYAWRGRKSGKRWSATPAPNNPSIGAMVYHDTLGKLATALAARVPRPPIAPF